MDTCPRADSLGVMTLASLLVSLVATLFPFHFWADPWNDWYVDVNDPNCANGSGGPTDPFCTITRAINAAIKGDRILIAPGTYNEHLDFQKGLHGLRILDCGSRIMESRLFSL